MLLRDDGHGELAARPSMVHPELLVDVVTVLLGIGGIIKRDIINRDIGNALAVVPVIHGVLALTLRFE